MNILVTFIELNADLDFDLCQSYPFANAVGGDVSVYECCCC